MTIQLHHPQTRVRQSARRFSMLCIATTLSALTASTALAQSFNTTFGAATFTCSNLGSPSYCAGQSNNRPAPSLYAVGDFWNQSIAGSGLASVSQLKLNLVLADVLAGTSTMQFNVLLNGTVVGSTPLYGSNGFNDLTSPLTFNFAAVSAATYNVRIAVISSTVPNNQQALGLYTDGVSTIQLNASPSSTVPEPGTYALLGAGLLGVGVAARRRASGLGSDTTL